MERIGKCVFSVYPALETTGVSPLSRRKARESVRHLVAKKIRASCDDAIPWNTSHHLLLVFHLRVQAPAGSGEPFEVPSGLLL